MKTSLFFIIIIFLLTGCKDNPVGPKGRNYEIPSGVGSYWKYAIYDSLSQEKDTVEVSIISINYFQDGIVTRWRFKTLYNVDTAAITFSADTIYGALHSFTQRYRFILISPIIVGSEYNTPFGMMKVLAQQAVTGKKEIFENCFLISNPTENSTEISNINYWIKPGIGVVKVQRYYEVKEGGQRQKVYWEIIDYNIIR